MAISVDCYLPLAGGQTGGHRTLTTGTATEHSVCVRLTCSMFWLGKLIEHVDKKEPMNSTSVVIARAREGSEVVKSLGVSSNCETCTVFQLLKLAQSCTLLADCS